jgi:uncharacterized protein (TIGR00255 family)
MPIRSMTGFAQIKGQLGNGDSAEGSTFSLSLKSVNHRFLDLHFRLPSEADDLEMKLRRILKEKLSRGHIEVTLNLNRSGGSNFSLNRELTNGYVKAFRAAASEFGLNAEPDLNAILRMPGAMEASVNASDGALEAAVLVKIDEAISNLNQMRSEEGKSVERELRQLMARVLEAQAKVGKHRAGVLQAYKEKLRSRLEELMGSQAEPDRILQEAALIVDRSDIQEELVRLENHVQHFLGLLDQDGEIGKKLDFLLQEMNREANTLLSKTSGLAGDALDITQMGLALKSAIEKAREQVQNVE